MAVSSRSAAAALVLLLLAPGAASPASPGLELSGDILGVEDPTAAHEAGTTYVFSSSQPDAPGLIPWRSSVDLQTWTLGGSVFDALPEWVVREIPDALGLTAPDLQLVGDEYRMYYSVASLDGERSAIGLAVSGSLDPESAAYGWSDHGMVISAGQRDDFRALHPSLVIDAEGNHWLTFGSFRSGVKLIALDSATGLRSGRDDDVRDLAQRRRPGAVEAPYIIPQEGGGYFLFVSHDYCCRGADSDAYTVVGRADDVTGPYQARDGRRMRKGGGQVVLHSLNDLSRRFVGPGQLSYLLVDATEYLVYHAYDTTADGRPALRLQRLGWTPEGWPVGL